MSEPEAPRRRGRPRDPERERRIIEAAYAEYAERGWAAFTMDAVARRAGVGKSTLYLRWTNKDELLADAVNLQTVGLPEVDTGSLRGDLEALARNVHGYFFSAEGWAAFRIAVDHAGAPEPTQAFADRVHAAHRSDALDIVRRALDRGEVRPGLPAQIVIETIYGAMAMRRMVRPVLEPELAEEARDDLARELADFCLQGIGPWLTGAEAS